MRDIQRTIEVAEEELKKLYEAHNRGENDEGDDYSVPFVMGASYSALIASHTGESPDEVLNRLCDQWDSEE